MAIHDWTRVKPGLFHHFHQRWIGALCDALNAGGLPEGFFALSEQTTGSLVPDVLTLQLAPAEATRPDSGGVAVAEAPPRAWAIRRAEVDIYAERADRLAIRDPLGDVVAIIEIVSPGNKSGIAAARSFVDKAVRFLRQGVNLLIIDLFPPTKRDPQGLHKLIWDEIQEEPFEPPPDKPLTLVAYSAGEVKTAYVEPVAVGDPLPPMPIFLTPERYVPAPLEATYQTTWAHCPAPLRALVDSPAG